MARLSGKRAFVTGAASGIGRAVATRFAAEGARVACADLARSEVEELAASLDGAVALGVDVRDEENVALAIAAAEDAFGGLDTIVANAGIQLFGAEGDRPAADLPLERWDRTLAVNLTGVFLTCKHGIAALLRAGGGTVTCTASPTSLFGLAAGFTAYSSSKGGVYALVRVLANDYGRHGIRVNAVIPGFTETPLVEAVFDDPAALESRLASIPLGRPGTAEEVASMMVFVASDEASYATGAAFVVDGGLTAV